MYDHTTGNSSVTAYAGRNRSWREKTSAAHKSARAVQPVVTWCQYSQDSFRVTRKLMIAPSRATYSRHATASHRKYAFPYRRDRNSVNIAAPSVTATWRMAASSSTPDEGENCMRGMYRSG